MVADVRGFPESGIARRAPIGKCVVDEHNAVAYKTIIAYRYHLAEKAVRLYPATPAYHYTFLYLYKRTNETVITYGTLV
jgi:hypothetical protein